MKKIVIRIILIILILFWMYVVFTFSASTGDSSSSLSKSVASFFTNNEEIIEIIEPIIRKIAHLSEYTLCGFLIFGFLLTFNISLKNKIIFSGIWRNIICYNRRSSPTIYSRKVWKMARCLY